MWLCLSQISKREKNITILLTCQATHNLKLTFTKYSCFSISLLARQAGIAMLLVVILLICPDCMVRFYYLLNYYIILRKIQGWPQTDNKVLQPLPPDLDTRIAPN